MPTVLASAILAKARVVLQDATAVRWLDAELLGWINDGQREIAMARPDLTSKTVSVALIAGTRQALPSDGMMLVKVSRNMGAGGATPGEAIRKVPIDLMDSQRPTWHSETAAAVTKHYLYDPRAPRVFFVWPPATGSTQVEIAYSASPVDVATVGTVITVDDVYATPLLDYVLFRAYSKDLELAANVERAAAHRAAFGQAISVKVQTDGALVSADSIRG